MAHHWIMVCRSCSATRWRAVEADVQTTTTIWRASRNCNTGPIHGPNSCEKPTPPRHASPPRSPHQRFFQLHAIQKTHVAAPSAVSPSL